MIFHINIDIHINVYVHIFVVVVVQFAQIAVAYVTAFYTDQSQGPRGVFAYLCFAVLKRSIEGFDRTLIENASKRKPQRERLQLKAVLFLLPEV